LKFCGHGLFLLFIQPKNGGWIHEGHEVSRRIKQLQDI
jgi:hypothetical protein